MLDYIRAETPVEKRPLLEELFAQIVFYDNRVAEARVQRRADGKYEVEVEYEAAKRAADGLGKESALGLDDWIEVGAFARAEDQHEDEERTLYLQPHRITQGKGLIRLVLDEAPYEVGLDPYNKLIDRIPIDNRKTVD
jgi:hypothetical protein